MVNIILCGPGASRKHELIGNLSRECHGILCNHRRIQFIARDTLQKHGIRHRDDFNSKLHYLDIQRRIIEQQCIQEQSDCTRDFITDNCVVSGMVHASLFAGENSAEEITRNIPGITQTLDVYKLSLVMLLGPCSNNLGDNICVKTEQKWETMKKEYVLILRELGIPFIDVATVDLKERTQIIRDALKGKIKLETSHLKTNKTKTETVHKEFCFHMQSSKENEQIKIPTINVYEHHYEQQWTDFQKGRICRFIQKCGHKDLICIHFDINVRSSIAQKMLLDGITVNGDLYSFLGCSSSGLKNRKCYMLRGNKDNAERVLNSNGNFSQIKSVSKRLARIGLLFSEVKMTNIRIESQSIIDEEDIKDNGHIFSDGCGKIGSTLAEQVFSELSDDCQPEGYVPSVFQIRLQGFKGTLAVDKTIPGTSVVVRPSMKKFSTLAHPFIGICDYSKANVFGHLNKQYIMLLSGLGVPDSVFLNKQDKHLEILTNMTQQPEAAIMLLQLHNRFELAIEISKYGKIGMIPEARRIIVRKELKTLQKEAVSKLPKLNILIPKSRNLFGIVDTTGTLVYGQCFLRVTASGKPITVSGKVVVCKNPCYLLGDVRVLTAVNDADFPRLRQLNHLVDCIVFPGRGKRPHADEIAGSDLDGDQYFVSWDEELIPKKTVPPYVYPTTLVRSSESVNWESIIAHFSKQNETQKMIGRVNNYFIQWANMKGVTSDQCERLGQLFSVVIDSSKTGEDINKWKGLVPPPTNDEETEHKHVWQKMKNKAIEFSKSFAQKMIDEPAENEVSDEFVNFVVEQKFSNISEFSKFDFCWRHLMRKYNNEQELLDAFIHEYLDLINFSQFSITEKEEAIIRGVPRYFVMNALNTSHVLSENELKHFKMESYKNTWHAYCFKSQENFEWNLLLKALTTQDMTLIAIELPDRVKVVVQFLKKQEYGLEQKVSPGAISALFFSNDFQYTGRYVLGSDYVLDLTVDTLQLYQGIKTLTFLWLKATDRVVVKQRWNKPLSDEIVNSISINLLRFNKRIFNGTRPHPLINKVPFVSMEMYVQSHKRAPLHWDIFDANDLIEVPELEKKDVEEESETSEAAKSFMQDILSTRNDSNTQTLQSAAAIGNPFIFIRKLREISLPSNDDIFKELIYLLETIGQNVFPLPILEDIENVLIEIIAIVLEGIYEPLEILRLCKTLSQLHLFDIVEQILRKPLEKSINAKHFLELVSMWESAWWIEVSQAKRFFLHCFEKIRHSEVVPEINIERYLCSLGIFHVNLLLNEIETNRQHIMSSECPERLVSIQNSILRLRLDQSRSEDKTMISFFKMEPFDERSRIMKGKYVAISRQRDVEQFGSGRPIYCVGQIKNLSFAPFSMSVKVEGRMPLSLSKSTKVRFWRADIIGNITTYKRVADVLNLIVNSERDMPLIDFISRPQDSSMEALFPLHFTPDIKLSDSLNLSQREAVISSLKQNISLIQGPPGTGKSTVACEIVKSVCSQKHYNGILVVAETNVAVDNLARRLRDEILVLRTGSTDNMDSDLYEISIEGQIKTMADREAKKVNFIDEKGESHLNKKILKKVFSSAEVVLTTCASAADEILRTQTFEFVLIDEATLTMDTTLMCCLCHGAKHLVMIGDPNQLGPVACETIKAPPTEMEEFTETLFHRLYKSKVLKTHMLEIQYRMHPVIMKFPSCEFYDGKLKAAQSITARDSVMFPWPCQDVPMCFVDIQDNERRNGKSFYNQKEVEVVETIVNRLLCAGKNSDDSPNARLDITQIGILTFYQAQVHKMKKRFKQGVMVNSVDGFQGQEKDVIVVSTVRCNANQSLGFTGDARRINVLLTRAKRGLIIVGNEDTLQASEIWSRWLEDVPKLHVNAIEETSDQQEGSISDMRRGRDPRMRYHHGKRGRGRRY